MQTDIEDRGSDPETGIGNWIPQDVIEEAEWIVSRLCLDDASNLKEVKSVLRVHLHGRQEKAEAEITALNLECEASMKEIATLRREVEEANADCRQANELTNAAIDDYNTVREILAAAFDEWEGHNGRLTDPNYPHWSNDAIRSLADKEG